jgi:hypothetical protein
MLSDLTSSQDIRPVPDPTILTTQQLLRELSSLRELLTARLDAMDKATALLSETINRTPTAIHTAVTNIRNVYDERFQSVERLSQERLASIALQFRERDVRTDQAAIANASALAAALQAAKEAVAEQANAAAQAAAKTESSFTKQIDQIQVQLSTVVKGFDDKLTDLKERIDRGEGADTGSNATRTERRLDAGQLISGLAVLVAVIGLLIVIFRK